MSPNDPTGQGGAAGPPTSRRKPPPRASTVKYKAALRKAIRKNMREPEIDGLNITAMLDLMTIILVFMLQSMASSATAVQDSDDLKLARSIMTAEPSDQGVKLVISKTAILLGESGRPVLELPSRELLAQQGIDARHKRGGPNDLYIVPLANRLENARKVDKQIREAMGKDASTSEAIIVADAETPYRLLIEVLFTLGQSEFGKYHLLVMKTTD
jgi:biopolymer transport protein ExbD